MTANGEFTFTIPEISLEAQLSLEDDKYPFPMRIDTLCILPEDRRFVVTWRAGFKYSFIPEQIRVIRVRHVPDEQ